MIHLVNKPGIKSCPCSKFSYSCERQADYVKGVAFHQQMVALFVKMCSLASDCNIIRCG